MKPHGFGGQLRLSLDDDYQPGEFLFIGINGKFVPFAIETWNDDACIVKLKGLDNVDMVTEFVNLPVLELLEEPEQANEMELSGYTLTDTVSGRSFDITGIVEYPGNILIEFRNAYSDALLPMHPDIILNIDHSNKTVLAQFPDGLLDL